MKVVEKLSDSGGFLVEAIRCVLINNPGEMEIHQLQYKLFQLGVFAKASLINQAAQVLAANDKRVTKRQEDAPKKESSKEGGKEIIIQTPFVTKDQEAASEPAVQRTQP